jgi:hypothetical protein
MSHDATAVSYPSARLAIASGIVEQHAIEDQGTPAPGIEVTVEPTGDADVDAALERLAEIPERATSEHADVYEDVHRQLQAALADLGTRP